MCPFGKELVCIVWGDERSVRRIRGLGHGVVLGMGCVKE